MPIWKIPHVLEYRGGSRSQLYADMAKGLWTRPVKISGRAVGIPSEEVVALVKARVAGHSDEQVRVLVEKLHEARVAAVEVAP